MGENLGSDVAAILEVLSERCPPPGQNSIFRDRAMIIMTAVLVVLVEAAERSGHVVTRDMIAVILSPQKFDDLLRVASGETIVRVESVLNQLPGWKSATPLLDQPVVVLEQFGYAQMYWATADARLRRKKKIWEWIRERIAALQRIRMSHRNRETNPVIGWQKRKKVP